MRHIVGKLSTSSFQRYKVCTNRSSDEGVMAPGSRGIGAVFVHSSGEDSDQTGDAFGEPRVPRRSRSHYLSNAPGLADQLVASRKDSAREGGSCAAYFCKVPDSRESELGLVRYGPASRVHRGVFGPFEGSFPIRIPADPDKFLAIREFHVVHGCVLFPMCPGSQINLLRVRKTLCASAATSVGKFPEISAQPYFVGLFSRAWPCTEASLGSRDMILRTEAVGMVPYAKGGGQFDPVFGLVNSPVKPWSNLVNLGQTWSDLVKALQTLGNVPRTSFQGFLGKADPSRALETARSNLGQTSVNPSQTWSNLGKCVSDLLLGSGGWAGTGSTTNPFISRTWNTRIHLSSSTPVGIKGRRASDSPVIQYPFDFLREDEMGMIIGSFRKQNSKPVSYHVAYSFIYTHNQMAEEASKLRGLEVRVAALETKFNFLLQFMHRMTKQGVEEERKKATTSRRQKEIYQALSLPKVAQTLPTPRRPAFHIPRPPRTEPRQFQPLPIPVLQLYTLLVKKKMITPVGRRTRIGPQPTDYKKDLTCEYHRGEVGHTIENCKVLRHRIQDLLDQGVLKFRVEGIVNAIGAEKSDEVDIASTKIPWEPLFHELRRKGLLTILRAPKESAEADTCKYHFGAQDHNLQSCKEFKKEVASLMSRGLIRRRREQPEGDCMTIDQLRLSPYERTNFQVRMDRIKEDFEEFCEKKKEELGKLSPVMPPGMSKP
uniref:Uncharacterized protein n=1 Tax=Fagus sylvatica TaxID=28930 RepID=A0A2N9F5K4_FAGSY